MKKEEKRHERKAYSIAIVVGFLISLILMAIVIYFAYSKAYETGMEAMAAKILGLPIYHLIKEGDTYIGQSIGLNMGIVSLTCVGVSVFFTRILLGKKSE